MTIENIDARDLEALMQREDILLIDVREPYEYRKEHVAGAELFPLSGFNPAALPDPAGRKIVFMCAGGVRSARAVAACRAAGLNFNAHLKGGIAAWKAAGLPTVK
jgi:rhodanese-related sulfurtransferase